MKFNALFSYLHAEVVKIKPCEILSCQIQEIKLAAKLSTSKLQCTWTPAKNWLTDHYMTGQYCSLSVKTPVIVVLSDQCHKLCCMLYVVSSMLYVVNSMLCCMLWAVSLPSFFHTPENCHSLFSQVSCCGWKWKWSKDGRKGRKGKEKTEEHLRVVCYRSC